MRDLTLTVENLADLADSRRQVLKEYGVNSRQRMIGSNRRWVSRVAGHLVAERGKEIQECSA